MLLNIFAEPVTKVLTTNTEDLKKAIHYLENELEHTTLQNPITFGSGDSVPYSLWDPEWTENRTMQLGLIAEEFEEFRSAVITNRMRMN